MPTKGHRAFKSIFPAILAPSLKRRFQKRTSQQRACSQMSRIPSAQLPKQALERALAFATKFACARSNKQINALLNACSGSWGEELNSFEKKGAARNFFSEASLRVLMKSASFGSWVAGKHAKKARFSFFLNFALQKMVLGKNPS